MDVSVFAFTASASSSGAGRNPASLTQSSLARGSFLGLLLLLLAVPPPAIASGDVMLGRKGPNGTWNTATEFPLSDHVHLRVDVPQNASSGEFTVNHPDGWVEHPAGSFCMFGTQRAFTTGLLFTGCCLDDEWTVSCVVHRSQGGDLTFGPTSFSVKNLSIRVPGPDSDPVFWLVALPGSQELTVRVRDGIEVLPPGADPEQWVADVTLKLVSLHGGADGSTTVSAAIGDPTDVTASVGPIQVGLYYKDASVRERMLSAPSGGPDTAEAYSSRLWITALETLAHYVAPSGPSRHVQWQLSVEMDASPTWTTPQEGRYCVLTPACTFTPLWDEVEPPASESANINLPDLACPCAGTYVLGLTFKDNGGNAHDGSEKWCRPRKETLDIPAAAHFVSSDWGYETPGDPQSPIVYLEPDADCVADAENAYDEVGEVHHYTDYGPILSFYSARVLEGIRGGVVLEGTKDNFKAACEDDHIVQFCGHGCDDYIALRFPRSPYYLSYQQFATADIVAGAYTQLKVAYLGACETMKDNDSIGHQFVTLGQAQSAIGYVGLIQFYAMRWVDDKLWEYLAKDEYTVQGAANTARDRYVAEFGQDEANESGVSGIHVAPSPCSTRIAPAF